MSPGIGENNQNSAQQRWNYDLQERMQISVGKHIHSAIGGVESTPHSYIIIHKYKLVYLAKQQNNIVFY